jgi:hypothetical protein
MPAPGNAFDLLAVEAHIRQLCPDFPVREIAFDPTYGRPMMASVNDDGCPVVEFGKARRWRLRRRRSTAPSSRAGSGMGQTRTWGGSSGTSSSTWTRRATGRSIRAGRAARSTARSWRPWPRRAAPQARASPAPTRPGSMMTCGPPEAPQSGRSNRTGANWPAATVAGARLAAGCALNLPQPETHSAISLPAWPAMRNLLGCCARVSCERLTCRDGALGRLDILLA